MDAFGFVFMDRTLRLLPELVVVVLYWTWAASRSPRVRDRAYLLFCVPFSGLSLLRLLFSFIELASLYLPLRVQGDVPASMYSCWVASRFRFVHAGLPLLSRVWADRCGDGQ